MRHPECQGPARGRGRVRERTGRLILGIAAALTATQPIIVQAQDRPLGPVPGAGAIEPPRRLPLPEPAPAPQFDLPVQPPPADRGLSAPAGLRMLLRGVRFEGNSVIDTATLESIVQPYVGRAVSAADLERLRLELSQLYLDRGYATSGAVLPDQDASDGVITYRLIEGELTVINIEGAGGLDPDYLARRLRLGAGPPLNVNDLSDQIRVLLQDPLIRRLNGEIVPGLRQGQAELNLQVERAPPYDLMLAIDNYRNASVGEVQGTLDATIRNLTGHGDAVRALYQQTEGAYNLYAEAGVPVTAYDTRPWAAFYLSNGQVIEDELEELKIRSEEQHYQLGVRQPVWRTPANELAATVVIEYERSKTFLLDEPFSFSPGVENGRSELTVLRVSQEFVHRGLDNAIAARSRFSKGLDVLGPTRNDSAADGLFSAWLGQFYWMHRFSDRGDGIVLRGDAQLTRNNLLPIEQFQLGGAATVRGYGESTFTTDNALFGSVEGRVVVVRLNLGRLGLPPRDTLLTFAPFFDYGRAWNKHGPAESIYSTGAGLLLDIGPWWHGELYYAKTLKSLDQPPGDSLQEEGILFRVVLTL